MEDYMNTRIFVESSEVLGLMYKNYKNHPAIVLSFLDEIQKCVGLLLTHPEDKINIAGDITKFKKNIIVKNDPEEIDLSDPLASKNAILHVKKSTDVLLDRLSKLKNKIAFGGNYYRAVIKKPKVYSKDTDDSNYRVINYNIRNINRALDWVEKIVIDLYNLADQDLNILTVVNKVYGKNHIYESTDLYEEDKNSIIFVNPDVNVKRLLSMNEIRPIDFIRNTGWNENVNESVNYIRENYVFSQKDLEVNMDQWKIGGKNTLFITGQAGSGKSTLAENIVRKHNALWIGIDFFECDVPTDHEIQLWNKRYKQGDIQFQCLPYILKFYETYPEMKTNHEKIFRDDKLRSEACTKFVKWIIQEVKDLDQLVIIEGVQLAFDVPHEVYDNYPMIIMGTSMLKSLIRRIKRGTHRHGIKCGIRNLICFIKRYKMFSDDEKILDELRDQVQKEGLKLEMVDPNDTEWFKKYMTEGVDNKQQPLPKPIPPQQQAPQQTKEPPKKPESLPKKTDKAESSKNGVRRKKLYIAFIEWAKGINPKNTFGSIFDKDAFHVTYPFVPDDMRYFYRLANPMLCVLTGNLTFFAVAELRSLNAKNSRLSEMMIFAATKDDLRVFNKKDKKVYRGIEENGMLKLAQTLGDTFDTYLQKMINQGDILNAPLNESVNIFPPSITIKKEV